MEKNRISKSLSSLRNRYAFDRVSDIVSSAGHANTMYTKNNKEARKKYSEARLGGGSEKEVTKNQIQNNMSPKKMSHPLIIICEPNRISRIISKSTALKIHGHRKYRVLKRTGQIKKLK